jgi:hypothetical protein
MNRLVPRLLGVLGLLLLFAAAFGAYVLSFPITDPSFEDLERRLNLWHIAYLVAAFGGLLSLVCVGWLLRIRSSTRRRLAVAIRGPIT